MKILINVESVRQFPLSQNDIDNINNAILSPINGISSSLKDKWDDVKNGFMLQAFTKQDIIETLDAVDFCISEAWRPLNVAIDNGDKKTLFKINIAARFALPIYNCRSLGSLTVTRDKLYEMSRR